MSAHIHSFKFYSLLLSAKYCHSILQMGKQVLKVDITHIGYIDNKSKPALCYVVFCFVNCSSYILSG